MRARLVRPELCDDENLAKLPDEVVLFYIKLWMMADDEGYFRWSVAQIGAALYPYRRIPVRQNQVERWLERLVVDHRIHQLECGVHGVIPSIPRHRFQGGKTSDHTRREHGSEQVRNGFRSSSSSSVSSENATLQSDTLRGVETREEDVPEHLKSAPWNRRRGA